MGDGTAVNVQVRPNCPWNYCSMTAVEEAFRWARIHAVRHMDACEQALTRWGETSITEVVTSRAAKAVTVVSFTQRAEALSGADWIWWWIDARGAYGMLVQAKRVTVDGGKWKFDFSYPGGTGTQRTTLMTAAAALDLLPVYALYLGTGDYRGWDPCPDGHRSGRCLQCVKRSVSLMPALLADEFVIDNSTDTYEQSVALEELWTPSPTRAPLIPALRKHLAPVLLDFLTTRQYGSRAVTRSMIDRVLSVRIGTFQHATPTIAPATPDGRHDFLGSVFPELPEDMGHFGLNYFRHVLNPLRPAPPGYVLESMTRDFDEIRMSLNMSDNIAGVVVVRLDENG